MYQNSGTAVGAQGAIFRLLTARRAGRPANGTLAVVGAALAIVPVWLNVGVWDGWRPRHLLIGEAGLLGVHYATSGLVLGLSFAHMVSKRAAERP